MMHPVATGQDTVEDPLEKLIIPRGGGGGVEVAEYVNRNSPQKKFSYGYECDPWIRLAGNLMYHGMDRAGR